MNISRHLGSYIVIMLVWLAGISDLHSQDPIFSQFYNAPIQLNPGLAGLTNTANVAINYRNQWYGWPQAYSTYSASFDQFYPDINSGLGIQVLTDNAGNGILKTNKISGVYAYRLQLNRKLQARIGLEASLVQSRLNWDRLVFGDQIQPFFENGTPGGTIIPSLEMQPPDLNPIFFDVSMGAVLFNDQYYFGISLKHLNAPNDRFLPGDNSSYSGLPLRFSIHGGWEIDLDGYNNTGFGSFIAPSILLVRQSGLSQLNAGALFNKENFFAGGWLRHNFSNLDAAIFSFGWRTDWLKLSYSFDLTLSAANISRTTGSHEVGILINLGGMNAKESRYEDCFSIFR